MEMLLSGKGLLGSALFFWFAVGGSAMAAYTLSAYARLTGMAGAELIDKLLKAYLLLLAFIFIVFSLYGIEKFHKVEPAANQVQLLTDWGYVFGVWFFLSIVWVKASDLAVSHHASDKDQADLIHIKSMMRSILAVALTAAMISMIAFWATGGAGLQASMFAGALLGATASITIVAIFANNGIPGLVMMDVSYRWAGKIMAVFVLTLLANIFLEQRDAQVVSYLALAVSIALSMPVTRLLILLA